MRILHYSLGIYPHRTGGLNRYCTDLIREQSKTHKVALLYPSGYSIWQRKCHVSKPNKRDGIIYYRLINAEPVPLLYGIKNPKDFYGKKADIKNIEFFYNNFHPDVLHLHTMMGLPEEVLKFFKDKEVRIVYTSHDYFGICPKVNFMNAKGNLCDGSGSQKCMCCNKKAPTTLFLKIRNSEIALAIRDFFKWIKSIIRY